MNTSQLLARPRYAIFLCLYCCALAGGVSPAPLRVITSNHPLALLVAAVAPQEVTVGSVLPPAVDPHQVHLAPTQIRALVDAQLVVWQGPELDAAFAAVIGELPTQLSLQPRSKGAADAEPTHSNHYGHIWLNPKQATVMVQIIAIRLAELIPAQAPEIKARSLRFSRSLEALARAAEQGLSKTSSLEFLALHDAYRPLQEQFGLRSLGFIYDAQGESPGAKKLWQLENLLKQRSMTCVFTQPQFPERFLDTLNLPQALVRRELDPMASSWTISPDAFLGYYQAVLKVMTECLQGIPAAARPADN